MTKCFLIGNVGENCHALKNPPGRHCAKKMLHKLNWKSIKMCPRTHFVHERMSEKKKDLRRPSFSSLDSKQCQHCLQSIVVMKFSLLPFTRQNTRCMVGLENQKFTPKNNVKEYRKNHIKHYNILQKSSVVQP